MQMDDLYGQAIHNMERTVHILSQRVPQPVRVPYKDGFIFRHIEKSLHQALIQKSARMVSTLGATRLLLEHGFLQEQASLQRILDEMQEDISFLSFSIIYNATTHHHQMYLDAFFEEEFDTDSALTSTQNRAMVPRKKIRAYIARIQSKHTDSIPTADASHSISKAYSGFVHAASPQIMDMYGGYPPKFYVRGMNGTLRQDEHRADLWNYFYRSIMSFSFIAKAFGDDQLFASIHKFVIEFENATGKNYESDEWNKI
jgi:hypothetical protein